MTEDEIKARVKAASERFQRQYVIIALPREFAPLVERDMANFGLEMFLADDGEDDGMAAFVAGPSSSVLGPLIASGKVAFRWSMGVFLVFAGLLLAASVAALDWLIMAATFLMLINAGQAIALHRRYEKRQKMQAYLQKHGF